MTVKELKALLEDAIAAGFEDTELFYTENGEPVAIGRIEYHEVDHDEWEDWNMPEGYKYLEIGE